MGYIERLTREVKKYDRKLYAMKGDKGKILIMRESYFAKPYYIDDKTYFYYPHRDDHLVFPLTDNWLMSGTPGYRGTIPVMERLKMIDLWNRDVVGEMREHNEKVKESKARDFRNRTEDVLHEAHGNLKKAWSDLNVSSLDKTYNERKYEKRIKK